MAEALAVFGGVVSGIDLVKTLLELKKDYESIRNAPQDINLIICDAIRLNALLAKVTQQYELLYPYMTVPSELIGPLEACRGIKNTLLQTAITLREDVVKWRSRGSVKAFMQRDKILSLRERMKNAQLQLIMAQNCLNT